MSTYYEELENSYGTKGLPASMAFTQACAEVESLRLALAASQDDAERERALNTRLIRELADKTTPPTDELTGLPTPTPKH